MEKFLTLQLPIKAQNLDIKVKKNRETFLIQWTVQAFAYTFYEKFYLNL